MIKDRKKIARPTREAADWYTRLNDQDHPEIEVEELEAFSAWKQDPDNRAAYERVEDVSRSMGGLRDDADMRLAAAEALERGAARRRAPNKARRRRTGLIIGSLAAACLVATVAGLVWRAPTYSTGVGQAFSATLEDGSRVQLNTDSAVRVRYSRGERRIDLLRGQALFQVAHNAERPFIVAAGATQVRALGTRFEVRRIGDEVRVLLAQGSVEVSDKAVRPAPWRLTPGQAIALAPATPRTVAPKPIDVPAATSWTSGKITFEGVPLGDAVSELNRYTPEKIVLGDGVPRERHVSGVFSAGDHDDFILAVSSMMNLQTIHKPSGEVELQPKGPAPG